MRRFLFCAAAGALTLAACGGAAVPPAFQKMTLHAQPHALRWEAELALTSAGVEVLAADAAGATDATGATGVANENGVKLYLTEVTSEEIAARAAGGQASSYRVNYALNFILRQGPAEILRDKIALSADVEVPLTRHLAGLQALEETRELLRRAASDELLFRLSASALP